MKMEKNSLYGKSATKTAFTELFGTVGYGKDSMQQSQSEPYETKNEVCDRVSQELNTTVIAEGTMVDGTICTNGHVECKGIMNGDIAAGGVVTLSGELIGNIQGETVTFYKASVKGNVTAKKQVDVDKDTRIHGDIQAENVTMNGRVIGSIFAQGQVSLQKNALLEGDIKASAVSMEAGARHCGKVEMELAPEEPAKKTESLPSFNLFEQNEVIEEADGARIELTV